MQTGRSGRLSKEKIAVDDLFRDHSCYIIRIECQFPKINITKFNIHQTSLDFSFCMWYVFVYCRMFTFSCIMLRFAMMIHLGLMLYLSCRVIDAYLERRVVDGVCAVACKSSIA